MNEKSSVIPDEIESRRLDIDREIVLRRPDLEDGALRVACILDEFSFASYSPQGRFTQLTNENWLTEIEECQPEMLMVESAWRGHNGSWWNTVQRCGQELLGILEWCRARNIPTVFWNKEDPVHFATFLRTASEFDVVFTTDVDCIPKYRASLGHDRVYFLPFAAQTQIHNPLDEFERTTGCSFAGAYYAKYPDRNRDFNALVPELRELGTFHIYDRNYWEKAEEQEFPEQFQDSIVGTLKPTDIAVAYKGYDFSLNLNSVKESQSMFARRVFELMASNTLVISNFARGLGILFGDLVVMSDGPQEVNRRLSSLRATTNGIERLRRMAMRKVLREHTYNHRFAYICEKAGVADGRFEAIKEVLVICETRDAAEWARAISAFERQKFAAKRLVLIGDIPPGAKVDESVIVIGEPSELSGVFAETQPTYFAILDPESWYGPEYLADMIDQFQWADERFVGIGELNDDHSRPRWGYSTNIPLCRGVGQCTHFEIDELIGLVDAFRGDRSIAVEEDLRLQLEGLNVPQFQYLAPEQLGSESAKAAVSDLTVDMGRSISFMNDFAASLDPARELAALDRAAAVNIADILQAPKSTAEVKVMPLETGEVSITSTLEPGKHNYIYAKEFPKEKLLEHNEATFYFETDLGVDTILAFLYFSESGERLGHTMVYPNRNQQIVIPDGTAIVRPGVRVLGPGTLTAKSLFKKARNVAVYPVLSRSKALIVTNRYPSYESIYQNGFIHSRVRRYRELGITPEVFCLDESVQGVRYREYRGIQVISANSRVLKEMLSSDTYQAVLVHFLSQQMWDVLRESPETPVFVWVHGFEAQPWWRRKCAFRTESELARGKQQSAERIQFWTEVLEEAPGNWTFVFVSQWLADGFFSDLGKDPHAFDVRIIHNIIDTESFPYREKSSDDRFKVLSIRPFASKIYANDLSVAAVEILSRRPEIFEQFEFNFFGDGPLFDETVAPLERFENVHVHQTFLTTEEIREQHSFHGVFLSPCRMDTQGVSRGEAMASGLVPIVSRVAAVPEFVDSHTGLLTAAEDAEGIAAALEYLAGNPEVFQRISRNAANRVANELSHENTTDREFELFAVACANVAAKEDSRLVPDEIR